MSVFIWPSYETLLYASASGSSYDSYDVLLSISSNTRHDQQHRPRNRYIRSTADVVPESATAADTS